MLVSEGGLSRTGQNVPKVGKTFLEAGKFFFIIFQQ